MRTVDPTLLRRRRLLASRVPAPARTHLARGKRVGLSERFRVARHLRASLVVACAITIHATAGLRWRVAQTVRAWTAERRWTQGAARGDSGGGLSFTRVHYTVAVAACTPHARTTTLT